MRILQPNYEKKKRVGKGCAKITFFPDGAPFQRAVLGGALE